MTAARNSTLFVVEGSGDFPVDMLRYDRAFCVTPLPHPSRYQRRHRDYQVAKATMRHAFKQGAFTYEGIGWLPVRGSVGHPAG